MVSKHPPYFWRDRHGRPRVRIRGKTFPMRDEHGKWHEPGTEEGDRLYWRIRTGGARESSYSWEKLIESYRASSRYAKLRSSTRSFYEKALNYIVEMNGSRDIRRLERRHVIAAQEANQHRTRFANLIVQVLSILCEHAIDKGWVKINAAKGVRFLETPEERKRRHVVWPDWAVDLMRAEAGPRPRLIFELGVGSVQRPGDLVDFTWGDYDGDCLRLHQNKGGKFLVLPCTDMLKSVLDEAKAALSGTPPPSRHIITNLDGSPMSYDNLAKIMIAERKRLGITAFDQHAMRYRGMQELARHGCTDEEIEAYSGHDTLQMVKLYTGPVRQEMRARQAREKLRSSEQAQNSNTTAARHQRSETASPRG